MTDTRYEEIKAEASRLYYLDYNAKTVQEVFASGLDSPSRDAYLASLDSAELPEYRRRRTAEYDAEHGGE